jgi:hypothetical protein
MKQWKVSYQNQDGVAGQINVALDDCPSLEEAAQLVQAQLFPVAAKLDLNDLDGRVSAPTAENLEKQNAVKITDITQASA